MEVLRGSVLHGSRPLSGTKGGFLFMESRRKFLGTAFALGVPAGFLALLPSAQESTSRQQPPRPQKDDDSNTAKIDPKLILEANQKEIKKNVEKLFDLASELKAEVEKTDSVQVLSLAMLRKTEEIEKLAKDIRNRAKG